MKENDRIEPTLLFSVLCDDIRREDNGKFMLLGLFETIGARKFPAIHPSLYVMNCWTSGLGQYHQRSRILSVEGKVLAEDKETSFSLSSLKAKHRIIARFNNLAFKDPGDYSVEVLLDGELKVRYPLVIKHIPNQPV